jgi:rubrerythrin
MKERIRSDRGSLRRILTDLIAAHQDELRAAAQLRAHAERVPYPQDGRILRELADIEERHAQAFSEQITALGGAPGVVSTPVYEGSNHWDRLARDSRIADDKRRRYLEQAIRWRPEYPRAAELFWRIAAEETAHRRVLKDLTSKADSLAGN